MSISDKTLRELEAAFGRELKRAERELVAERGMFEQVTGARLVLKALLDVGVIHPDWEEFMEEWLRAGGITSLVISNRTIMPPTDNVP